MAFSTQKEFFHVPFLNENVTYDCKKACVQLKSYESSIDDRSWARDEGKRSKFLSDLVNCKIPATTEDDECSLQLWNIPSALKTGPEPSTASLRPASSAKLSGGDSVGLGVLTAGDSLLQCANVHLTDYQKIKKIKVALEKELDVSNEKLKTANEEIVKIKEILNNKLDESATKDFHNKIQNFIAGGKFTKNEENEMLQIYQKMENLCKAYEVVQAENNYLKRLIEKLSSRVKMEQITLDPETSTNVEHLQSEVNKLRMECMMLRSIEDDYNKMKQCARKSKCIRDQDAENIRAILKERDSLRQKCQSLKKMTGDMGSDLESQASHIEHIESEMQKMQKYYEDKVEEANHTIRCLKAHVEKLKDDLVNYKCRAQKAEVLQSEVCSLRNEVVRRDIALNDYDIQYKHLMDVVNELQAIKLQNLEDNQTQTCNDEMDDLIFYTRATLNEIKKEVKRKTSLTHPTLDESTIRDDTILDEISKEHDAYALDVIIKKDDISREQSITSNKLDIIKKEPTSPSGSFVKDLPDPEVMRLKNLIDKCENECADALKRIQELESENNRLKDHIRQKNEIDESENECADALKRIQELESENNRLKDHIGEKNMTDERENECADALKRLHELESENNRLKDHIGQKNMTDERENECADALKRLHELESENNRLKDHIGQKNMTDERENECADALKRLHELESEYNRLKDHIGQKNMTDERENECANALKRLHELESENNRLKDQIGQKNMTDERENECADALKRLHELESENNRLKDHIGQTNVTDKRENECADALKRLHELESENNRLNDHIRQNEDKMSKMLSKIEQLDDELNRNRDIIQKCNNELNQTKRLVADIGNMQTENNILSNVVDTINSRDDEKIIDDLRRQLQEEMNKLKKCQTENEELNKDMKDLKNINNILKTRLDKYEDEDEVKVAGLALKHEEFPSKDEKDEPVDVSLPTKKHSDASKTKPSKVFDEFVNKNVDNLKITFHKGRGFENEFRKILNEFIEECGYCFSRFINCKSKFYTICHKLCLNGLNSLDFRELAYLHKKTFARAEQLLPGCLLDMILNEHKDEIQNTVMPQTIEAMIRHEGGGEQKCCRCRKELCCNKSEELLQEKVTKLEMDIEMAREYLDSLRSLPLDNKSSLSEFTDSMDANESPTYRPSMSSPKAARKQIRKHKSRILSRTLIGHASEQKCIPHIFH